jgi:hypothetical protein
MSVGSLKNDPMSLLTQSLAKGESTKSSKNKYRDLVDAKSAFTAARRPATDTSKLGEAMKQLDGLASSDRTKFKAVTNQIGQQLKALAQSATGDEAQFIGDLAAKFEQASESGNMSALQPPRQRQYLQAGATAYAQQRPAIRDDAPQLRSKIDGILTQALGI